MRVCPEIEFAPATHEGRAVLDVIDRPGVWKRAGMSGALVGLDLAEAMTSLPEGLDRDRARSLLIAAEPSYLAAWWAAEEAAAADKKTNG
jgi:hypothetical protein